MPTIVWQKVKEPKHDPMVKGKIYTFLEKLGADDTASGLHIEPMQKPADTRARTGRVDIHWRAVLFQLDPKGADRTYVYAGTWEHDEAIRRARTTVLSTDPVNGMPVFRRVIEEGAPVVTGRSVVAAAMPVAAPKEKPVPLLTALGFLPTDLTAEFGFDEATATRAFQAVTDDELLSVAESLDTAWQADVLVSMGAGTVLHEIKQQLGLDAPPESPDDVDDDTRLVTALKHPAAQMQFTFIERNEELREAIDDGDFGAWRIFLHPDQRRYAEQHGKGSFRITGGAGTGKTVVLLHRARHLTMRNPEARIILTTFTRALADALRRDLERLAPDVTFAAHLGDAGVLVRGVDQLAWEVRQRADAEFGQRAALAVIGSTRDSGAGVADFDWKGAIAQVGADLPVSLRSEAFFSAEYAQVVLPAHITTAEGYFAVRRAGRGVSLNRARRAAVWQVIERARKDHRVTGALAYNEIAAIAAEWLTGGPHTFADHILLDEAQDLEPAKWLLLRALVAEGPDDLFIADDTHQRIYGQPVVPKRYGVDIRGRSRRMKLNYRTTLETLRFALGVLSGVDYADVEGNAVDTDGYRSARSGPAPAVDGASSDGAQFDDIAERMRQWTAGGVAPETVAVLAVSNSAAKKVQQGLGQRGVSTALLTQPRVTGGQPVVMTMHMAKGMEFSRVVLFDVSDGSFPPPWAYKNVPEEDRADLDLRFRSLLYVAASRARDELVVTYKSAPSAMLVGE